LRGGSSVVYSALDPIVVYSELDFTLSSELGSTLSSSNKRPILLGGSSVAFSEASRRVDLQSGSLCRNMATEVVHESRCWLDSSDAAGS
jgi:hypothetical protein